MHLVLGLRERFCEWISYVADCVNFCKLLYHLYILIISFIINYKHLIMFMILGDNVLNEKHIPSSPQELKDTLFSILVLLPGLA